MTAHLLALILWLVPAEVHELHGEDAADARARYETIAAAVAAVAPESPTLALYLLTVARHESGFDRRVQAGKVRGDDGQSWGLYQVMLGHRHDIAIPKHPLRWKARHIVGVDVASTWRATWTAAWILGPKIEACDGEPTCVLKSYGGVPAGPMRPKTKRLIHARVSTYRKLRSRWAALTGEAKP